MVRAGRATVFASVGRRAASGPPFTMYAFVHIEKTAGTDAQRDSPPFVRKPSLRYSFAHRQAPPRRARPARATFAGFKSNVRAPLRWRNRPGAASCETTFTSRCSIVALS